MAGGLGRTKTELLEDQQPQDVDNDDDENVKTKKPKKVGNQTF